MSENVRCFQGNYHCLSEIIPWKDMLDALVEAQAAKLLYMFTYDVT